MNKKKVSLILFIYFLDDINKQFGVQDSNE